MTISITAQQAIIWMLRFLAVYILIDSAEKLSVSREFGSGGLFDWRVMRQNGYFKKRNAVCVQLADLIFNYYSWLGLIIMRGCAGLTLLLAPGYDALAQIMLLIVFVTGSLINLRNAPFGAETENRFALMIAGALLLRGLVPTPLVTHACLWFIALQSCLSYVTAGAAKLLNAEWRNGNGIGHVFDSPGLVVPGKTTYWLRQHNTFGKWLTWGTLGMECFFPLALIGQPFLWLFLVWGVLLHAAIAIFIRLGKFFWIWIAAYPAIIFVAH